jgi:hypothetical protein
LTIARNSVHGEPHPQFRGTHCVVWSERTTVCRIFSCQRTRHRASRCFGVASPRLASPPQQPPFANNSRRRLACQP